MKNQRSEKESGIAELKRRGFVDQKYTGEAYAFFDSPKRVTNNDMRPEISDMVVQFGVGEENFLNGIKAKKDLRQIVKEGRSKIIYPAANTLKKEERELMSEYAKQQPFEYGVCGKYGKTNEEAAEQLVHVVGHVYGRHLQKNEPLRALIVYKDDMGKYVSKN